MKLCSKGKDWLVSGTKVLQSNRDRGSVVNSSEPLCFRNRYGPSGVGMP